MLSLNSSKHLQRNGAPSERMVSKAMGLKPFGVMISRLPKGDISIYSPLYMIRIKELLMPSKIIVLFSLLLFLVNGVALAGADDPTDQFDLLPSDLFYDIALSVEAAQLALTIDPAEKLLILKRSSNRTLDLIGNTTDHEERSLLLAELTAQEQELWSIWDGLDEEQAGSFVAMVAEIAEKRSSNLHDLLESDLIPNKARSGIERALQNQLMALEKQQEAMKRAEEAHAAALLRQEKEKEQARAALESAPVQPGATPGRSDSPPGRPGTTPGGSGSDPGRSGATPGGSGFPPGRSDTTPGSSGFTPGRSDTTPGHSGSAPGHSGSAPGNSDSAPGHSGSAPGNSGAAPGQN